MNARQAGGIAAALLGLALLPVGCGSESHDHAGHASSPAPSSQGAVFEDGVPVHSTLPAFELVDEQGRAFTREDLRAALSVSDFIFTTCPDACPMLTREMAKLQERLAREEGLSDVLLVSFSVDPETDTPEALTEYAGRYDADLESWRFVTGTRPALMELIQNGFKLPVMENADAGGTPFLHSQKFVLVDRQGRIRGYYDALEEQGRERLLADLRRLSDAGGNGAHAH